MGLGEEITYEYRRRNYLAPLPDHFDTTEDSQ